MNSKLSLLVLFCIFFNTTIYALQHVAQVTKVRGNVTQLVPGSHHAIKVKKGDLLYEDTSVVTSNRSFVKIKFIDNSVLSVGPKSKVVVNEIKLKRGGVISLLKGKIRTKVQKGSDKRNKFMIKTRTAALGVRGTDFQTIYNADNKVTNLLTYKGEVAMAKITPELRPVDTETHIVRDRAGKVNVKKIEILSNKSEFDKLDKLINKKNVVVKSGQFSGTLNEIKTVSEPVKINKQQLGLLYQNEEFNVDSDTKVVAKTVSQLKSFVDLQQSDQEAPAEGFVDNNSGRYAPKAGGFIDLNTGLYVPPMANAKYDASTKTFVPEQAGKINVLTGEYIAPKGLKLDAKEGFVVDSRYKKSNRLLAYKGALNNALTKTSYVKKIDQFSPYTNRELFTKDIVALSLKPHEKEFVISNKMYGSDYHYNLDDAQQFQVDWKMAGNGNYRPRISFNYSYIDFKDQFNYDEDSFLGIGLFVEKYRSSRWSLLLGIDIQQEPLPVFNGSFYDFKNITLSTINLGFNGTLIRSGRYSVDLDARFLATLHKQQGGVSVNNGVGHDIKLGFKYLIRNNRSLDLNIVKKTLTNDISYNSIASETERTTSGLSLVYTLIF